MRSAAGLAGENRHVVPGIADGGAAAEDALMLGDDAAVLADHHAIGIGLDLDRSPHGAGADRVLVVVEANQAGLRDRCRQRVEAVEPAGVAHQVRSFGLEHLPDGALGLLGMRMRLGIGDAAVEQDAVQLVVALHPQPWREEALAHQTRPGSRPAPSPIPTLACRRPARRDDGRTSAGSGDCSRGPCRRRSSRRPSSCCRRRRAGTPP